jgi:hypothetical protein
MDPMWEYGEPVDHNRTKLSCKLCGMEMYGGINRLKYHLAKVPGHEVEIFPTTPPDVVLVAKNSILDITRKKKQREELKNHMGTASFSGAGET